MSEVKREGKGKEQIHSKIHPLKGRGGKATASG